MMVAGPLKDVKCYMKMVIFPLVFASMANVPAHIEDMFAHMRISICRSVCIGIHRRTLPQSKDGS